MATARNALRCSIGDAYVVDATFERRKSGGERENGAMEIEAAASGEAEDGDGEPSIKLPDRRLIHVTLLRANNRGGEKVGENEVIGRTSFPWPELRPPDELRYDSERSELVLTSARNVARLPIRLRSETASLLGSRSAARAHALLFADIGRPVGEDVVGASPVAAVIDNIGSLIREESASALDEHWRTLERSLRALPTVLLASMHLWLSPSDQAKLVVVLDRRISTNPRDAWLIEELVRRQIVGFGVGREIVRLLRKANYGGGPRGIVEFICASPLLAENAFVEILKLCAEPGLGEVDGKLLIANLLGRPFSPQALLPYAREELDAREATTIVDRLLTMIDDAQVQALVPQILDVISLLIDAHSQQIVWDDRCHARIQAAADSIADMTASLSTFSSFLGLLEAKRTVGFDLEKDRIETALRGDYAIVKMPLRPRRSAFDAQKRPGNRVPPFAGPRSLVNVPGHWHQPRNQRRGGFSGAGGGRM